MGWLDKLIAFLAALFGAKPIPTPGPTGPTGPTPSPTGVTGPAPVRITRNSNFRTLPTISPKRWKEICAGFPFEAEAEAIYNVTGGRPLPLAQSWMESRYGQDANALSTRNPLGLLWYEGSPISTYQSSIDMGGGVVIRLLKFPNWAAAFKEWRRRMDDPNYKGGVYPQAMTMAAFIRTYVAGPGPGYANGESADSVENYLVQTVNRINRYYGFADPPTTSPPGGVSPGSVPKPANYEERIIAPGVNTAWDDLGRRIPRGIILHRMLGTLAGTDAYFRGAARGRACTDFGIGQGLVYRWTKPGGNVAPWASGPADGIDGDGTAFWNAYKSDPIGVSIFNRDCESIEIEGQTYDTPVPDHDYQRLVELVAWRADTWLKIPWIQWPLNNDGVHCLLWHNEVTDQKECPGSVVMGLTDKLIEDVRARLRSYQGG